MLSPIDGARMLNPSPDDTWGTHLVDVNIALGNLTSIVGAQSRAWVAARGPHVRRLGVRLRARGHVLIAAVSGAARERVLVTVGEAARTVRLARDGRRVVRFFVDEEGVYRAAVRAGGRVARSGRVRVR
jgi:hypothetical protein